MPHQKDFAVALHGGAGVTVGRRYDRVREHLEALLAQCRTRLGDGVGAVDVVEFAVASMEASGLYVAGRGSAPNVDGYVEMDASIMDGARMKAGAVAALRDAVHPVSVARGVMDDTPYVLITGEGAQQFARQKGYAAVADPATYFVLPEGVEAVDLALDRQHGTVGAVALARDGALAAATSTGGLFGTAAGRVGDTPLIGAGTWADDTVAISCTGTGEDFILTGGAQLVATQTKAANTPLRDSARHLLDRVADRGGDGGLIAVSRNGDIVMAFNSPGMKRAAADSDGRFEVAIF